ncbi:MurR/RpiR family transcriptional regulator [Spiroplasma sp. SV19]|uniref:MurR/RpiR family transcriptional regulator n=1 Tax=Spiroplasma sp. SV19 TaxID=2570468 RepID=UPI0024B66DBA|nr:MurR/RpiR family transcriptional regulator [Spiroplasma sp. SV19]WHQ37323.1 MurR/RpiR family transcriptional regulator [Spiroplasma sp. SV19]
MDTALLKQLQMLAVDEKNLTNQTIARYILTNLAIINNLTTSELASNCFTSPAGIIRFCQKLGLEGINELKFKVKYLLEHVSLDVQQFNANKQLIQDEMAFFNEYLKIKIESAQLMHTTFFQNDLTMLIEKITTAKTVFIFAFNLAYNVSRNFVQRLRWINKNVIHQNDLNSIESYLPMITVDDMVFYITLSGQSNFIASIAKQVNSDVYSFGIIGKKTALTNHLTDYFVINSRENEIWDVFSIRSQTVMQFLDYLYAKIIRKYF